jgi:DNA-directed RNA polymerase specialized sigma24 family protein
MDEKTHELRDIFTDVTETDTVTERQAETRGSLLGRDDDVRERLLEVVGQMRARYEFDTDLSEDDLAELVHAYYDGASDTEIGRRLDVARSTVVRARLALHLLRERDREAPFDLDAFRRRLDADPEPATSELAEAFDVSPSTVRRYRRVVTAAERSRRANERFREAFDDVLADVAAGTITDGVREDGLDEATEDIETDVSF